MHISVPSLFLKPNWLHVVSKNSDVRFSDWCRPLQILHDLETDEDVSHLAKQQCGFEACVLDGEQNLHRASCGFGARHGRRRSVCEGEFACGSAAIRTFQE